MRKSTLFLLYLIVFHAAWTIWLLVGYPRLRTLGEDTLLYALINLAIRALVWVLPVFISEKLSVRAFREWAPPSPRLVATENLALRSRDVCNRFLSALSERIGPTARSVWIAQRCRPKPRRRNRTHQLTSKHRHSDFNLIGLDYLS